MKLHRLLVVTVLIASPAYANDAMTVLHTIGTEWQAAYNAGDAGKVADLYFADAVLSSGALGTVKGKAEIEKAVANQMKQTPKITVTPTQAWQSGNVVFGYGDFAYADGPSGHYGLTVLGNKESWHIAMHISNATPAKKP